MEKDRLEYHKLYYKKNKEKIQEYLMTKIQCPKCMKSVCRGYYPKHQNTLICQRRQKLNEDVDFTRNFVDSNQTKQLITKLLILIKEDPNQEVDEKEEKEEKEEN